MRTNVARIDHAPEDAAPSTPAAGDFGRQKTDEVRRREHARASSVGRAPSHRQERRCSSAVSTGARQHLWLIADPRPHNHPWEWIDCKVLRGSYKAIEYIQDDKGDFIERAIVLHAGDPEHRLLHGEHHQVIEVEPGTISVMSFGYVVGDGKQWGHLRVEDGVYIYELAQPMGGFVDALWHCNPHLRKEGWVDPYADQPDARHDSVEIGHRL
jgi:hypothetical protein